MRKLLLLSGVMVCAGATVAALAVRGYHAPGPLAETRDVVVPRGGIDAAAAALMNAGVIHSRLAFKVAAEFTAADGPLRAAELRIPALASLQTVLGILRSGRAVQHKVTIAEGLTVAQVSALLAPLDTLTGNIHLPNEGSVLPDTYVFERGTSPDTVLTRARVAMRQALMEAWSARAPGLPVHTPDEVLTLASIVEREARLPAERPMIARVFLNRLALGMRLQADPTAAYGASGALGHLDRPLDHADLERDDHYNTYVVGGLPAGPICNPGLASIRAVLHPADGNALYFVADGTGGHLFTDRLAAHDANVAHLRAVRR